jgi:hypothetical protein
LNNWCKPSNKKDLCLVKLWIPWRLPFVQWTPVAEVVWKRVIWVSGGGGGVGVGVGGGVGGGGGGGVGGVGVACIGGKLQQF